MPRNLDRRVEALVRCQAEHLQEKLGRILDHNLADERLSWTLHPDGTYTRVIPIADDDGENLHDVLEEEAAASVAVAPHGLKPTFGME